MYVYVCDKCHVFYTHVCLIIFSLSSINVGKDKS